MNGTAKRYLMEIKRQHEDGTLSMEQATDFMVVTLINQALNGEELLKRLVELEEAHNVKHEELEKQINERFDALEQKVDTAVRRQSEYPSVTYLLRYRSRDTVVAIIFLFVILSTWFVSGFRQPILEWLGLPIF
jgi:negative regulator of genetic competence, sporulation and motility